MLPSPAMMICNISRVSNFYFPAFLIIVNADMRNPTHCLLLHAIEAGDLPDSSQADIRNPLLYLLIIE